MMSKGYVPSKQVQLLIKMIVDSRAAWRSGNVDERRFNRGIRHGFNGVFRALVELETGIDDPDDLDVLCSDLIADAQETGPYRG